MADRIIIRDLLLRAIIGINPGERTNPQDVLINVELEADLRPAGASDDIDDALNYRTVAKRIAAGGQRATFKMQVPLIYPDRLTECRAMVPQQTQGSVAA